MVCHELVIQSQNHTMIILTIIPRATPNRFVYSLEIFAFEAVQLTRGSCFIGIYYMACVCNRYNARSDWLIVTKLLSIILP